MNKLALVFLGLILCGSANAQLTLHGAVQFNDDHVFTRTLVLFQELTERMTTLALSLLGVGPDASAGERAAAVRRRLVASGGSIDQIIFLSDLIDAPLDAELAALEEAMEVATRQRGR